MGNYFPYNYGDMGYQQHHYQQPYLQTCEYQADDTTDLNQLKRSLNLVQTRKKEKDRYQWYMARSAWRQLLKWALL